MRGYGTELATVAALLDTTSAPADLIEQINTAIGQLADAMELHHRRMMASYLREMGTRFAARETGPDGKIPRDEAYILTGMLVAANAIDPDLERTDT